LDGFTITGSFDVGSVFRVVFVEPSSTCASTHMYNYCAIHPYCRTLRLWFKCVLSSRPAVLNVFNPEHFLSQNYRPRDQNLTLLWHGGKKHLWKYYWGWVYFFGHFPVI